MPSISAEIPEYNNAIVNVLRSDGDKSIKAVLYSFNPAFDREVVTKAEACRTAGKAGRVSRAKEQLKHLDDTLARYGIAQDRVVYLESATGSKYCAESAEIYKLYLKKYKSRLNHEETVMIRDAGSSFTPGGVSVFSTVTPILGRVVVMPPMLHHFHSPCDNRHHGAAKAKWRTLSSHSDDVVSSLLLLHELDNVTTAHIQGWFDRNFCYGTYNKSEDVLSKALASLYFGKQGAMHEYHEQCLDAYYVKYPDEMVKAEAAPVAEPSGGYVEVTADRA